MIKEHTITITRYTVTLPSGRKEEFARKVDAYKCELADLVARQCQLKKEIRRGHWSKFRRNGNELPALEARYARNACNIRLQEAVISGMKYAYQSEKMSEVQNEHAKRMFLN